MDELQQYHRDEVLRRIKALLNGYVTGGLKPDATATSRFREDLNMDKIDTLYFLADLEEVFGVPMHSRSLFALNTIDDAVRMAFAASPDFIWVDEPVAEI